MSSKDWHVSAGGFPEAFLNPKEAARLRNDRMELVTREDLRDLGKWLEELPFQTNTA